MGQRQRHEKAKGRNRSDAVIVNATQLETVLEELSTLQRMQEAMRLHLREAGSSLFPVVSEGYTRRIEKLQTEIIEYLREHPAESPLSVRLSGPTMKPGVIRATLVSDLIAGFQSALYQVGRLAASEDATEGEPGKIEGIRSVLGLNMIATASGSFILAMDFAARQEPRLFEEYDVASSTMERLVDHVNELRENPEGYTGDQPTLRGLQKVAALVKRDVETIEVVYRGEHRNVQTAFDPTVRERIEYLLGAPREGERTVRGTLIEINIENNTCKVHPSDEAPVDCDYEESLEDDLIAGLKREIEMAGQFIETARPGRYKITKIERFKLLGAKDEDVI